MAVPELNPNDYLRMRDWGILGAQATSGGGINSAMFPAMSGAGSSSIPAVPTFSSGPAVSGAAAMPGVNPTTPGLGTGLDWNIGTGQLAMSGLNGLAQLWTGMQSAKLAREQFDFTKRNTEMNTNNQMKSYNAALEDKYRTRGIAEGRQSEMDALYNRNRMTR